MSENNILNSTEITNHVELLFNFGNCSIVVSAPLIVVSYSDRNIAERAFARSGFLESPHCPRR